MIIRKVDFAFDLNHGIRDFNMPSGTPLNTRSAVSAARRAPLRTWLAWERMLGLGWRLLACVLLIQVLGLQPAYGTQVWGRKPVLEYFALTASLTQPLQLGASLSDEEMKTVQEVARWETDALRQLERESRVIVQDPMLSLEQKRRRIAAMGFNQRVEEIIHASQARLRNLLDEGSYARLVRWVEQRWPIERKLHGVMAQQSAARTFRIYATRYDSKGAYYVALPDKCPKFTNGGNSLCVDYGYVVGQTYSVYLSYQKGTSAIVGEAGPWNVDDAYWATYADPTPRRMFADLPLGIPEAQAAYFNGYNGGKDQFGRTVTAPYGIDLARQVSIDIGLQPGVNDWINVSYMWTAGWGSGGSAASGGGIAAIVTATPQADGSIIHRVESGQTLSGIALAYEVSLQELLELNHLTMDAVIHPGDELIVRPAQVTSTLTPEVTFSLTPDFTPSLSATTRPSHTTTLQRTGTTQPSLSAPFEKTPNASLTEAGNPPRSITADPVFLLLLGLIGLGVVLLLFGRISR